MGLEASGPWVALGVIRGLGPAGAGVPVQRPAYPGFDYRWIGGGHGAAERLAGGGIDPETNRWNCNCSWGRIALDADAAQPCGRLFPAVLELEGGRYLLDWWNLLDPYYFYRPLRMSLPWSPLLIGAIGLSRRDTPDRDGVRTLLWICLVVILGMSLGGGKRDYYLLPLLGLFGLIASISTINAIASIPLAWKHYRNTAPQAWEYVVMVVVVCLISLTLLPAFDDFSRVKLGLMLSTIGVCASVFFLHHQNFRVMAWLIALGFSLAGLGANEVFSLPEQAARMEAAQRAAKWVPKGQPIYCYVDPAYAIYYSGRTVFDGRSHDLSANQTKAGYWVLTSDPPPAVNNYPAMGKAVYSIQKCDNGNAWQLSLTSSLE